MKKFLCTLASAALFGVGGIALADVVGSVHDLTAGGGAFTETSDTDEVCVFCHTPHAGSNNGAPLWNRTTSAASYTMYNNAFSSTIDMAVAGSPQGVSAACLSCHDGTIAFDVLINGTTLASGSYGYNAAGADQGWTFTSGEDMSARGLPVEFDPDLTNQHPISVTYDPTADPAFQPAATVTGAGGLVLYGGNVECGTCHNPHDTTNVPFLRKSNAASAICTTCHIK